jgi:hypothetical protein
MPTDIDRIKEIQSRHGITFSNEPVVDDRPDIENRVKSRSWFSHEHWGELTVDTSDSAATLQALKDWVMTNNPAPVAEPVRKSKSRKNK